MSTTTDPNDPRLTRGVDPGPTPQADVYLVLSEEERAMGFVRRVRVSYQHVGPPGPRFPLRPLTDIEHERYDKYGYAYFEEYPDDGVVTGKFWTEAGLAAKGCGSVTTMARDIAETYARNPKFYGATYCCSCRRHLPVDEFVWDGTTERVGS